MLILGIDASSRTASAALADGARLIAQSSVNNGLTHSQTLLPMIKSLLATAGVNPSELGGIAVTVGPGSFTGLRIGLATAAALAWPDLPCAEISSLEAAAMGVAHIDGEICAVMDARRSQFYCARFAAENNVLTRISEDAALSWDELSASIKNTIFVGDGAEICYNKAKEAQISARIAPQELQMVRGWAVCKCAISVFNAGLAVSGNELKPRYLRIPQAERERIKILNGEVEK